MLAAMTHPSRVLNLDMKAKLCMPKSYIYIYITFMSLQRSVYFTYIVGSIRYRYFCCFRVGIRILIRFMTSFQAEYQCAHEHCVKTVVCVLWGL